MELWEGQGFLEGWHLYVMASKRDLLHGEQLVTNERKLSLGVDGNQAGVGMEKNSPSLVDDDRFTVGEQMGRQTAL